jgi:HlyD family secretion protein
VQFTVDAYPADVFTGTIHQVRLNPTTVQNVVTYTVVVESPNVQLKLLPGMTANLAFQIEKRAGILRIPNAALRYVPKPDEVRVEDRALLDTDADAKAASSSKSATIAARIATATEHAAAKRRVWVLQGDLLAAREVVTGLSDNSSTELLSGPLQDAQDLVTGTRSTTAGSPPPAH